MLQKCVYIQNMGRRIESFNERAFSLKDNNKLGQN